VVCAMDFASLKEQVSNLTLYDIKAGVRKVQNGISIYSPNPFLLAISCLHPEAPDVQDLSKSIC